MLVATVVLTLAALAAATFDPELHAKYLQLPREEFIQYFNKQNYSWKITHYPHLENMTFFGEVTKEYSEELETIYHDAEVFSQLPLNFDARQHWEHCPTIKEIYDQGHCGSCWAVAASTIVSDRTCIGLGLNVRLSPQDLSCASPICWGGAAKLAFRFWIDHGLVTRKCKPYNIIESEVCKKECKEASINYDKDKHFGKQMYHVSSNENEIKAELFKNGPVYASFAVYEDFRDYKNGVYTHKYGDLAGFHGVRVIGYGIENGVNYWLVANSWGTDYGENGLVKIKRYQELLNFEDDLYSGLALN